MTISAQIDSQFLLTSQVPELRSESYLYKGLTENLWQEKESKSLPRLLKVKEDVAMHECHSGRISVMNLHRTRTICDCVLVNILKILECLWNCLLKYPNL